MAVRPATEKRSRASAPTSGTKKTGKTSNPAINYQVADFDKDDELKAYHDMLLIRRFEEKAGQLYGMGLIGGFCHLYIGQEAVVIGIAKALREGEDQVTTSYRDHGHMLACGMDPKGVMAELTGARAATRVARAARCTCSAARSSSSAATASSVRRCRSAPVSPLPTSIAAPTTCRWSTFGDGAANQGQVYETFNMAQLWKLPVIFVIENNRYAMGTSVSRSSAQTDFAKRGESFNIPGEQVDGMDVRAVKAAADRPSKWARAGNGPYILEMQTYRYRGHSMSDPAKYRTKDEVQKMRDERDPDRAGRKRLVEKGWASEDDLKEIDKNVAPW
jgi:Pyruvate/2-oxoglutarate dehydrogenase complex, dehydrogenase (E1) component, eukaryotic type, alpha subunit